MRLASIGMTLATAAIVSWSAGPAVAHSSEVMTGQNGSASLAFSGSGGDTVTQDKEYSFSSDKHSLSYDFSSTGLLVTVVHGDGQLWSLSLATPRGQDLKVGKYTDAQAYSTRGEAAGIELRRNQKKCATIKGEFEVRSFVKSPQGRVEAYEIGFKQFCDSESAFSSGVFSFKAEPAPPPLLLTGAISKTGKAYTIDSHVGLEGTLSCSRSVSVALSGRMSRIVNGQTAETPFSASAMCEGGKVVPWIANIFLYDKNSPWMKPGPVRVYLKFEATDALGSDIREVSSRVDLVRDDN